MRLIVLAMTGVVGLAATALFALRSVPAYEPHAESPAPGLSSQLPFESRRGRGTFGDPGRATIGVLVHWDCPHCQDQLSALQAALPLPGTTEIVILSIEVAGERRTNDWPGLSGSPAVEFGVVNPTAAEAFFGTLGTPAIALMDPNGTVVRRFVGYTDVEELVAELDRASSTDHGTDPGPSLRPSGGDAYHPSAQEE